MYGGPTRVMAISSPRPSAADLPIIPAAPPQGNAGQGKGGRVTAGSPSRTTARPSCPSCTPSTTTTGHPSPSRAAGHQRARDSATGPRRPPSAPADCACTPPTPASRVQPGSTGHAHTSDTISFISIAPLRGTWYLLSGARAIVEYHSTTIQPIPNVHNTLHVVPKPKSTVPHGTTSTTPPLSPESLPIQRAYGATPTRTKGGRRRTQRSWSAGRPAPSCAASRNRHR